MLVYLASPIDSADPVAAAASRMEIAELFEREGVAMYDPATAFRRADLDARVAYAINERALREADGLLAVLPDGVPSVGVPMEILACHQEGRPVVATGPVAERSMQIEAMGVPYRDEPDDAVIELISRVRESQSGMNRLRWVGEDHYAPRRGYAGDAGFDLVVSENRTVWPGEFVDVPCGVSVQLPPGVWAMITGRSSTLRKRQLLVSQGIIDQGYRGPLFAGVWNLGREGEEVRVGERIAQLIPFPQTSLGLALERVDELDPSDRGDAGFGSTGV